MISFGLSCDEITWRLIQSIPRGMRSKVIREAVKMHAPQILELRDEFWKIELEKKKAEEEHRLRLEAARQRELILMEREREIAEKKKLEREKQLELIAKAEFEHFTELISTSQVLVESSGNTVELNPSGDFPYHQPTCDDSD